MALSLFRRRWIPSMEALAEQLLEKLRAVVVCSDSELAESLRVDRNEVEHSARWLAYHGLLVRAATGSRVVMNRASVEDFGLIPGIRKLTRLPDRRAVRATNRRRKVAVVGCLEHRL